MLQSAQIGLRGTEYGEFQRGRRRVSSAWNWKTRGAAHTGAQRGEGSEPGTSTSPGGTGSKQLRGRSHARGAGRAAAALDRAGDPHRITVAGPYPPPSCLL